MHETGVPSRQCNAHPGADDNTLTRSDIHVGGQVEVTPRIAGMGRARYRQIWVEPDD